MKKTSNFKILWHACTSRNQLLWKICNFEFSYFLQKKRLFQIKTAITFAYGLEKKYNIWKTIYTKSTSDFNSHRPFAQILASQNSKGKYESRKILDFVKKIKIDFFENFEFQLLFLLPFSYFEVFILFWNF
jgi:hypothetical protein